MPCLRSIVRKMQFEPGKRHFKPAKAPFRAGQTQLKPAETRRRPGSIPIPRAAARLLLVVAILNTFACRTPPKPAVPQVGWRPIGRWSGHGNDQTDSFNIESGQFRIKWVTSNERKPGEGKLRIMVHSAVSGRPLVLAGEHSGTGHGVDYVNEDPRLFHLVIESQGVDWSVSVEESVVGVPES
jgi:hypothetical protein